MSTDDNNQVAERRSTVKQMDPDLPVVWEQVIALAQDLEEAPMCDTETLAGIALGLAGAMAKKLGRRSLIADMRARDAEGRRRWGTPLQPRNGRDAGMDAYQETLDALGYLIQLMWEEEHPER